MSDLLEVDCHRLRDEGKENTNREVVGRKGPAGDHTSLLARKWNHQNWLQHLFPHQKLKNSETQRSNGGQFSDYIFLWEF